jgi:hypothetical protein
VSWNGWSTDVLQVARNRVLAALLDSADSRGMTDRTPHTIIEELGVTDLQASRFVEELDFDHNLVDSSYVNGGGRGTQPVVFNTAGRRLAEEFREMHQPRERRRAACKALLQWLDDQPGGHATPGDILTAPHSWSYGRQFTTVDINTAAKELIDRQLVTGRTVYSGRVSEARLTDQGRMCVEAFDGDVWEMNRTRTSSVTIENYNQHDGNVAIASSGVRQTSTVPATVTAEQGAADLAGLLSALRLMNAIPPSHQPDADMIADSLTAVQRSEDLLTSIRRTQAFFAQLATFNSTNPAAAAVIVAGGNYAALSAELCS